MKSYGLAKKKAMVELLRPSKGGFLRPFGCGEFIWKFLLGHGPYGSPIIDPYVGAAQADIFRHYKVALMKATAVDRATRAEEEMAKRQKRRIDPENIERLTQRYLDGMPYKAQGCRFHSFIVYFSTLQRLGWVEATGEEEPSAFQDHYPPAVRRADISVSLTLAELPLRQLGLIPSALFTANIRSTGRKADNNCFEFMKSKENQRRGSCSGGVHIVFSPPFKYRLHRSNAVQMSTIYQWKNHL